MKLKHVFGQTALAAGLIAGLALPAHAAFRITEASVDGGWADPRPAGSSNGIEFDFVPLDNKGNGVLGFGAFMNRSTENQSGSYAETDFWLFGAGAVTENQYSMSTTMFVSTGGDYSTSPVSTNTLNSVGTLSVEFYTCNFAMIEFDVDEASDVAQALGLTDATWDYVAPTNVKQPHECPYQAVAEDSLAAGLPGVEVDAAQNCPAGTVRGTSRSCVVPGDTYTTDLWFGNYNTVVLNGNLVVGTDQGPTGEDGVTLEFEAGSWITNADEQAALLVERGNKLVGVGMPQFPIVFTALEPTPGKIGGIAIHGQGVVNGCDLGLVEFCENTFEALPEFTYGGPDFYDDSGAMKYWQIRWAGRAVFEDKELNSLTLLGVGRGTYISHIQIVGALDDGIEWFGGAVNVKKSVYLGCGDECIDIDEGYRGVVDHFIAIQDGGIVTGGEGSEISNNGSDVDALPRTHAVLSNGIFLNREVGGLPGSNGSGFRFKEGGLTELFNVTIEGYPSGIRIDSDTDVLLGADAGPHYVALVGNGEDFKNDDAGLLAAAFSANAGNFNATVGAANTQSNGFPGAGSVLLGAGMPYGDLAAEINDNTVVADPINSEYIPPNPNVGPAGNWGNWTAGWTWGLND
ncbi:MAG: hypothetical protein DHS20C11_04190 [Lysobacteraceae bacterium]|nr:MAG: hypothetical protein DHS20C11_04190 [Xanthomonadaceae bacterium]